MNKYFCIFIIGIAVLSGAASAYAYEISFDNYMAGATYSESDNSHGADLNSNWCSFVYKGNLSASKYDNKYLQGELFYGMSVSGQAKETWNINGTESQTNDMSFWGIDTGVALGWAFPIQIPEDMEITATPLIGYRYKFTRFTRQNFVLERRINISGIIVDEDYNVHSLDLGARVNFKINDKINVYAKPIFGIVLFNNEHNSMLGTIGGSGGFLFNFDAGLGYAVTKNLILSAAFRMELQRLCGGDSNSYNVFWPDNGLDSYGGMLTLTYKF